MKEPYFVVSGQEIPFSQCSIDSLRGVVTGWADWVDTGDGCADIDFDRRYAAILLKERGL